jgi:hypothetical protein
VVILATSDPPPGSLNKKQSTTVATGICHPKIYLVVQSLACKALRFNLCHGSPKTEIANKYISKADLCKKNGEGAGKESKPQGRI